MDASIASMRSLAKGSPLASPRAEGASPNLRVKSGSQGVSTELWATALAVRCACSMVCHAGLAVPEACPPQSLQPAPHNPHLVLQALHGVAWRVSTTSTFFPDTQHMTTTSPTTPGKQLRHRSPTTTLPLPAGPCHRRLPRLLAHRVAHVTAQPACQRAQPRAQPRLPGRLRLF